MLLRVVEYLLLVSYLKCVHKKDSFEWLCYRYRCGRVAFKYSSRLYLNLKNYDPWSGIMLMHESKKCHSEVFIQSHRDEVIFRGFLETFS